MRKIFLVMFVLLFSMSLFGERLFFHMKLTKIIDGDTYWFEYQKLPVKVRLSDVDAYESRMSKHLIKQKELLGTTIEDIIERGERAKKIVHKFLKEGQTYCIEFDSKHLVGYYGRYLGIVHLSDNCSDNKTISRVLLDLCAAIPMEIWTNYNK